MKWRRFLCWLLGHDDETEFPASMVIAASVCRRCRRVTRIVVRSGGASR